jgi:DNA-binding CsgD family transcriptional regulator
MIFVKHFSTRKMENKYTQLPTAAQDAAVVLPTLSSNFPVEVFPDTIKQDIIEHELFNAYPSDHSGLAALVAAGAAIGTTHVAVNRGFQVLPIIFGVNVGLSGTSKSAIVRRAMKPISDRHKKRANRFKEEKKEYKLLLQDWKKDKRRPEPEAPKQEKVYLTNVTLAGLAQALENSPRSVSIIHDEIFEFIGSITNKNKDSYLTLFNGSEFHKDIKNNDIYIELPCVNIFGTTQPSRLDVFSKNKGIGSGFSYRFLFSFVENRIKPVMAGTVRSETITAYDQTITNLFDLDLNVDVHGNPIPKILKLTDEAQVEYDAFRKAFTDFEGLDETEIGIRAKLEDYSLRFALILQLLNWAAGIGRKDFIELKAVEGSIKLTNYFLKSSIAAHDCMVNGSSVLTPREAEVIEMFNADWVYTDIEDALNISPKIIKKILHSNLEKLTPSARKRLK